MFLHYLILCICVQYLLCCEVLSKQHFQQIKWSSISSIFFTLKQLCLNCLA